MLDLNLLSGLAHKDCVCVCVCVCVKEAGVSIKVNAPHNCSLLI